MNRTRIAAALVATGVTASVTVPAGQADPQPGDNELKQVAYAALKRPATTFRTGEFASGDGPTVYVKCFSVRGYAKPDHAAVRFVHPDGEVVWTSHPSSFRCDGKVHSVDGVVLDAPTGETARYYVRVRFVTSGQERVGGGSVSVWARR